MCRQKKEFMTEISGGWVRGTEVRQDGWCEGGLGQQRNDWRLGDNAEKSGEHWCVCN